MNVRGIADKTKSPYSTPGKEEDIANVLALAPGRATNLILGRLKQAIETGILRFRGSAPAERQLAVTFGAARSTVRKVLDQLEQMNLVTRRAGSGTFVNYPGPDHHSINDVAVLSVRYS